MLAGGHTARASALLGSLRGGELPRGEPCGLKWECLGMGVMLLGGVFACQVPVCIGKNLKKKNLPAPLTKEKERERERKKKNSCGPINLGLRSKSEKIPIHKRWNM